MKTFHPSSQRGSAFITVTMFCAILLLLCASALRYSNSERRLNNRAKLLQEARLGAEAVSEYGISQVKKLLDANRTFTDSSWTSTDELLFTTGTFSGTSFVAAPADTTWAGGNVVATGTYAPTLHIGNLMEASGLQFIDPTIPDNANDPLKGKKAFSYTLDILSSATVQDPSSATTTRLTKYWQQKFSIRAVPLFANAVYFNTDIELWPISAMTITGSVHTNQHLFVRAASSSTVTFAGAVTAVKGVWTKYASATQINPYLNWYNETQVSGVGNSPGAGAVQILVAGTTNTYKSLLLTANTTGFSPQLSNGSWVESTWNLTAANSTTTGWKSHIGDPGDPTASPVVAATASIETTTTKENFADWTQQNFKGNLLTHVNGITPITLQGIPDYTYYYGSTYPDPGTVASTAGYRYAGTNANDANNSAHALIERPVLSSETHYLAALESIKYSRQCGLYIIANTTTTHRLGHKPDGNTFDVPSGQYRAFMLSGTTITEVLLPGQKFYGQWTSAVPLGTPNPYTTHRDARPIVQMNQISNYATNTEVGYTAPSTFTYTPRLMTDVRRSAGGSVDSTTPDATTYSFSTARSGTNIFTPKILRMIDLDMNQLKKAVAVIRQGNAVGTSFTTVATTANGQGLFYHCGPPTSTTEWNACVYNPSATPIVQTLNDTNRIVIAPAVSTDPMVTAYTTAIWNGGIYIESLAADLYDNTSGTAVARKAKTHELHDSGVRVVNGRGKVASLTSDAGPPAVGQGFTLATNDCVYILGDFNADGVDTTPATVAVTTAAVGASTGHNYETDSSAQVEVPASIACDSFWVLSTPEFSSYSAGAWSQLKGWNDAFSSWYSDGTVTTDWDTNWKTAAISASNTRDGITGASTYPYKVPYDAGAGNLAAGQNTTGKKLRPVFTEISTAILAGIVPTGKNGVTQNSGGLHNYPRFMEDWYNGTQVESRIRGSFVALFECRVGNEPYAPRAYSPPSRVFGFNLLFDTGAMPPLTPKSINFRRIGANDITKAAYNTKIGAWGYTNPAP